MAAGLPGTGIGGIFYLLLVAWMPLRELVLTLQGRSSPQRWRSIGMKWLLITSMVLMIYVQGYAIDLVSGWLIQIAPLESSLQSAGLLIDEAWSPALAMTPFVILAIVLTTVHGLRLVLVFYPRRPDTTIALRPASTASVASLPTAAAN
ncbi:MAG: hypothetical protein IT443_12705 [Phycisphaeraceae bacterium]|nr:hypothetical protein [Phycisphaeraceae bacterium]